MKFYEQENYIKSLVDKDPTSESVYYNINKLVVSFMSKKGVCDNFEDVRTISHDISVDVYNSIVEGKRYYHLIGYLERVYRSYVVEYYGYKKEYVDIDITDRPIFLSSYKRSSEELHNVINRTYLAEIINVIDEIMENSRYKNNCKNYNNLKLSLMLSLLNNSPRYFHIDKSDQNYLDLLIRSFKQYILSDRIECTEEDLIVERKYNDEYTT